MRDQCGVIFRQAKKELEASGLLNNDKEVSSHNSTTGEGCMASDIDKELENLQVICLLTSIVLIRFTKCIPPNDICLIQNVVSSLHHPTNMIIQQLNGIFYFLNVLSNEPTKK